MDIISHGLWGGVAFGRKNKKLFWTAFGFGIAPDLLSFGIFTGARILGLASDPDWGKGLPDPSTIPQYVHILYNFTHSLIIFALVFGLIWLIRRKPFLPLLAWSLHILIDIPTHSTAFFPTPFLWPVSNFVVNGISWGQPIIFYPDVILLAVCYLVWWWSKKRKK
ncbi:MAG: hypothetical protein WA057_01660 [Candidatus Magasanikiibacteriota bacterium]